MIMVPVPNGSAICFGSVLVTMDLKEALNLRIFRIKANVFYCDGFMLLGS